MALEEYLGSIVLEVDSVEVDVTSLSVTKSTMRKLVKTMNRTGRPKGFAKMMEEISLKVTAVVPLNQNVDWGAIEGAKLTVYPLDQEDKRTSYLDCFTTDVGKEYSTDNESRIDITLGALREVIE